MDAELVEIDDGIEINAARPDRYRDGIDSNLDNQPSWEPKGGSIGREPI
jgi:hypothetical protein